MSYIDHLIAHMQEETEFLYLLEHKVKVGWFLIDFMMTPSEDGSAAIWFPQQKMAVKFISEEDVEEFKLKFLSPRPVSIVKVNTADHMKLII